MRGLVRGSLVVAVLAASMQTVIAATPQAMQTAHDVLEEAKERDQARQARLVSSRTEVMPAQTVTAAPPATDTIQFHIQRIVLQGNPEEFGFLDDHLHAYIATDMGIFAVQKLAHALNGELLRKGYVTSQVIVPEQSLAEGTLILIVEPGRLHAVTYSEDSVKAPWKNAFPIREGDILNIRKLEQGVEQMKRISSQDVKLRLIPAAERGQTDVELTVTRGKRIHGGFSMDDSGLDSTGKLQVAANVGVDNLFNANDTFSVSLNRDGSQQGYKKGTRGYGMHYAIPFGRDTVSMGHSAYKYHQTVDVAGASFISSSRTKRTSVNWNHVVSRNATNKWAWDVTISKRHRYGYINDYEVAVQEQNTTSLELGYSVRSYLGANTLYARTGLRYGVGWFGAMPSSNISGAPSARYTMGVLDMDYQKPFTMGHRSAIFTTSFHGQFTGGGKRLYGSDLLSIGNRYTVRGFDGRYTLMGESGWYVMNEIASNVKAIHGQVYLGLDMGAVYGPSSEASLGRSLVGTVLGARGKWGTHGSYDVFIGTPLYKPSGFPTDNITTGFTVGMRF